jgi:hypothetical protein
MNRVSYDRFWGFLLLLTCIMPLSAAEKSHLWHLVPRIEDPAVIAWIVVGSVAGLLAFVLGLSGARGRWRHFLAFAFGCVTLAMPIVFPQIWTYFPYANPASLPMSDLATVGWVMLVALGAIYAGSGVRIVRPSQPLGQVLGGLGAFLLLVFAFLPATGAKVSYAVERIELFSEWRVHWRTLVPFVLVGAAVAFGMFNLVRTRVEVAFAKFARAALIGGLVFWIVLPFVEANAPLDAHLPVAWGTLRFLGPLFLAVDGTIAFMAISFSRGET